MGKFLVTGCRRTGTTFLGRILSINNELDLNFTNKVRNCIKKFTNQSNPTTTNDVSNIKRDSSNLINEWKDNLKENEIEFIKRNTNELINEFYDEDTWVL